MKPFAFLALFFAVVSTGPCVQAQAPSDAPPAKFQTDPEMRAERQKALERPRRVLWNHDGGGAIGLTKDNLQAFYDRGRPLSRLLNTQVDTIMFCSGDGFGMFKHFTKVGTLITGTYSPTSAHPQSLDVSKLDNYLDPLKVVIDFGRANQKEVFWSMRMNDTHDSSSHDFAAGMLEHNTIKQKHPEWLLGTKDKPPFHGHWTGMNYEVPEVRDLAFRFFEEVCQNYDVDGIELDFFRHPIFFKSADATSTTTQAQRDLMTDLMRRIRAMADAAGKKRGRPILIAIKVPDSLEYSRAVGVDWQQWLSEDLADILVPGGYIRMNPWSSSIDIAHRYGAKVYPSLDDPRIDPSSKGDYVDSSEALRMTEAAYNGRAMEAWADHADGVYLFNFFNSARLKFPWESLKEMGDPQDILGKDRTYFASYLGMGHVAGGGFSPKAYQTLETLSPTDPVSIAPGKSISAHVLVPEDLSADGKSTVTVKLRLKPVPGVFTTKINGQELAQPKIENDWISYPCSPAQLKNGFNQIEVALPATSAASVQWCDLAVEVHP